MSEVTTQTCLALAALARVAIDDHEAQAFAQQLERVVHHLDRLQSVDVSDVPEYGIESATELRDDVAGETLPVDTALSGAPRHHASHIVVPKFKDD